MFVRTASFSVSGMTHVRHVPPHTPSEAAGHIPIAVHPVRRPQTHSALPRRRAPNHSQPGVCGRLSVAARVLLMYTTRMNSVWQSKLTLVVDPAIVQRAKSYASAHNVSVSLLVETYLKNLTETDEPEPMSHPNSWPPTTRSLYGALADPANTEANELKLSHLRTKYLHD